MNDPELPAGAGTAAISAVVFLGGFVAKWLLERLFSAGDKAEAKAEAQRLAAEAEFKAEVRAALKQILSLSTDHALLAKDVTINSARVDAVEKHLERLGQAFRDLSVSIRKEQAP